jgi:hypothetical protein
MCHQWSYRNECKACGRSVVEDSPYVVIKCEKAESLGDAGSCGKIKEMVKKRKMKCETC